MRMTKKLMNALDWCVRTKNGLEIDNRDAARIVNETRALQAEVVRLKTKCGERIIFPR